MYTKTAAVWLLWAASKLGELFIRTQEGGAMNVNSSFELGYYFMTLKYLRGDYR